MKKVKLPKYPTFYMWEASGAISVWYPNGKCEILGDKDTEWRDNLGWFGNEGPWEDDIKICEIKD